jgi:hypothetical protein
MTARRIAALLAAPLLLLAARASADDAIHLKGTVGAEIGEAGFDLVDKRGTYHVALGSDAPFLLLRPATVRDVDSLTTLHVLAKKVGKGKGGEKIRDIQVVVVGDKFEPPSVPKDLADKQYGWADSMLIVNNDKYALGDSPIDPAQRVIVLQPASKEMVVKGRGALCDGILQGDGKAKNVKARRVFVCMPGVSDGEMKLVAGS